MKNCFLSILFFVSLSLSAQTTCQTAKPFCAGGVSGETFPATTNITSAQPGPAYGCLGSTPNPAWYFLQINQSGTLDILIQGQITVPPPPGPGQDVDFICWGPFNSLNGICDSLTAAKIVDCSYSSSFTETLNIINGVSGQYYMVLITNFANVVQDIQFSQYAGTGNTNCGLLGSNSKICAGNSATVVATNSGSLTNATYSMNPGNLTNTTGTFIVSPLATTNYTLFITGTNNLNQITTQTAVANVTVNPQPLTAPQVTNTTCTSTVNAFKLNLTFNPITSSPGYTVSWALPPNGITSAQQQSLTGNINSGVYTATITAAGGCSTVTEFTIEPQPEPAIIDIQPIGLNHTLTCLMPVLTLTSMVATNNYTWSNGLIAPVNGQFATFNSTALGTWTISAVNPNSGCIASHTLGIFINTVTPTSTVTPLFQNITCSLSTVTTVSISASPSVNVYHQIISPLGGTFAANSNITTYLPGAPGVYTDCAVDAVNGCSTCKDFTVTANQGYPTFSVQSPQNYTLGCNTKSVATINIVGASATNTNQVPTGGPVSYTLLSPFSSSATPPGTLSAVSIYTVNQPGTWTVVTKDNTSLCETRVPITILQNNFLPDISAEVPHQVLNCATPKTVLKGLSLTPNVSFSWLFPGNPGTSAGDSLTVGIKTSASSQTIVANYTLQIVDNSSTCRSTSIVPIYQNVFPPNAVISNGGTGSITCVTTSVTLTHISTTGIPATNTFFPAPKAVVGVLWQGPPPQDPIALSTTYIGQFPGVYTLTALDLNNGCRSTGTINIADNRVYPVLNEPSPMRLVDCGSAVDTVKMDIPNRTANFSYTWTPPVGVSTGDRFNYSLIANTPGVYRLVVKNNISGCATSSQVTLGNGTLNAGFDVDHDHGYAPLAVKFNNLSSSSKNNNGITSLWNFGNGTSTTVPSASISPVQVFKQPGIYVVTLNVFKGSCTAVHTKTIVVDIPSAVEIPNVFTPNGDKVNDEFFLKADNLTDIHFTVVDRWGHVVYDVQSSTGNILWDGKNQKGQEVAEGVFMYTIKASGADGQAFEKTGTITLLR